MKHTSKEGIDSEFLDLMILISVLKKRDLKVQNVFGIDWTIFKRKFLVRINNANYDLRSLINIYINSSILEN